MKIIHTSDWHLGQNFYRHDRDPEHRHFLSQLSALMAAERPDALLVSGDVFHNSAPTAQAQKLFVDGIIALHDASPDTVIVVTAGNHDSGNRLEAERELWRRLGVHVIGSCRRRKDGTFDPQQFIVDVKGRGCILAAPYFHPSNYPLAAADTDRDRRQRAFFDHLLSHATPDVPVVLMAHLAIDGCDTRGHDDQPIGGMVKEDPADLSTGYDYAALGHIHKSQRLGERIFYSGSPIPVSFSEDYQHYVNVVEIDGHGMPPRLRRHPIEPLKRVLTIPTDGGTTDQALEAMQQLSDTDTSYVRILIDQEVPIPIDFEERLRAIERTKSCRLCEITRKPRTVASADPSKLHITDIQDFERISPIDIAMRHYSNAKGSNMAPELVEMMKTVISQIENDNPAS